MTVSRAGTGEWDWTGAPARGLHGCDRMLEA
jgi:hypothetical protein